MAPQVIGIDLGGTKLSTACLKDGRLSDQRLVATERLGTDELIDEIVGSVAGLRDEETAAAGVGIPSAVEFATGRARSGVNVPLEGVPLRELLRERLELPVYVDNDANCAALAEAYEDGRLAVGDLVMFTVGTGVGGGLVLGGRIYRGATGGAAEIGHTLIAVDLDQGVPAPVGGFPKIGSLEALASGTVLDGLTAAAAAEHPDSALGKRVAAGEPVLGPDAVEAARAGDAIAEGVIRTIGERLGLGIANAINTFDPEVVAIGGGVSTARELLLEPAREVAWRYVLPGVGERTEIRLARRGPEAGVYGAALLALQELAAERER